MAPCQQVGATALPVKHPSRVRGPQGWQGGLMAGFGWSAHHSGWTCGFRLALDAEAGEQAGERLGRRGPPWTRGRVADALPQGTGAQRPLSDRGSQGGAWQEAGAVALMRGAGSGHWGGGARPRPSHGPLAGPGLTVPKASPGLDERYPLRPDSPSTSLYGFT